MRTDITKQDILDYFNNQHCENCEFKKECDYNEITFDALSLCTLFGV